MAAEIYQNALQPEAFSVTVTNGDTGLDMTTVTAASLSVQLPDGTTTTWVASISGATTTQLTVTHTMPSSAPSDVATVGEYSVVAVLTIPSGTVRGQPVRLVVRPYYGDPV